MEEIIGEIKDEFDEDELPVRVLDEHNYIFEGKTLINDFCRRLNVPYETFESVRGESDSLAGLVLELSGKFPSPDDVLHYDQFDFTVLEVEKMRLQKIKVTLHPEEAAESN